MSKEDVPWIEFEEAFSKFANLPKNEHLDINKKCLHAIVAEKTKKENSTEVVNIEQFGKILDWFGPLEKCSTLNMDNNIFDKVVKNMCLFTISQIRKLLMKQWFHGEISTNEAQVRLSSLSVGAYLVRFSTTHPGFLFILLCNSRLLHYLELNAIKSKYKTPESKLCSRQRI